MGRKRKTRSSCCCLYCWKNQKTPEVGNQNQCQITGDSQCLPNTKTSRVFSRSFKSRTPSDYSGFSSKKMSSSSATKTVSSFDSRKMNVLVTNAEQPPPHDDVATRIQQLEQGQQRIEALMENLLLTFQRPPNNEAPPSH